MTSTYTANQGIEKPATGDQSGTWGATVNTNMDIIDRTVSGVGALTLTGTTTTLTTTDGTLTDGMYRVLVLGDGGDLGGDNTITLSPNDQDKTYLVYNNLSANRNAIFSQGTGANATVQNGETAWIYADGAGGGAVVRSALSSVKIADQDGDTQIQVEEGGDDDDTLRFDTAGSERLTIGSSGAVDVVGDLTAATLNADGDTAAGDNAAIGYTAAEGLILTGQGSTDDITIKNDADTTVVNVGTGATDVEISAGNILFGTASKGVYLGVTAATAANLLDDYEEGSWTPVIRLGGESGTDNTAGTPTGKYTKIGNQVVITTYCAMDDSLSGTGQVAISGLPFTVNGTHNCPITWTTGDRVDGDIGILAFASAGSAAVLFYVAPATTSASLSALTQTSLNDGGAGKSFSINGTYYV